MDFWLPIIALILATFAAGYFLSEWLVRRAGSDDQASEG